MSLIQVLIAAGIVGVVALGVASVMQNVSMIGNNLQSQVGKSSLQTVLQKVLSQKPLCDAFINTGTTVHLPTVSTPGITDLTLNLRDSTGSNSSVVASGVALPKFDLTIATNGFHLVIPAGTAGVPNGPDMLWTGYVELQADKLKQAAGGQAMRTYVIGSLTVRVSPGNTLTSCEGFAVTPSTNCAALGGVWVGSSCQFSYTYPCPAGQILTGPNPPADCHTCPANQVLVFDGNGGFNCLPYP
jgi:hypothetical protein